MVHSGPCSVPRRFWSVPNETDECQLFIPSAVDGSGATEQVLFCSIQRRKFLFTCKFILKIKYFLEATNQLPLFYCSSAGIKPATFGGQICSAVAAFLSARLP